MLVALLIVALATWLAGSGIVLALCHAARRGDEAREQLRTATWEPGAELAVQMVPDARVSARDPERAARRSGLSRQAA